MSEWQPIETAPKVHGRHLLMFGNGRGFTQSSFIGCWWKLEGADGWRETFGNSTCEPTHWMPLPDPPLTSAYRQDEA